MATTYTDRVPAWFWLAAGLGLLWSLVGVCFYLGSVGILSGPFATPPGQPAMPLWATTAFAISVWGSVLATVGLLLRKRWARKLLWLALVAVLVDFAWVFFMSGAGVTPLGIAVIAIALLLALLGETAAKRGWLR
jgi:magnesium-transporting ATPase (P-type)